SRDRAGPRIQRHLREGSQRRYLCEYGPTHRPQRGRGSTIRRALEWEMAMRRSSTGLIVVLAVWFVLWIAAAATIPDPYRPATILVMVWLVWSSIVLAAIVGRWIDEE